MPGMDGVELADRIRGSGDRARPELILLTSLDEMLDPSERDRLELTCLHKPVRQSRLFDAMISVVTKRSNSHGVRSEALRDVSGASDTSRADSPSASSEVSGNRRVLIVDDNGVNRLVAGEILRSAGYEFDEATNGREAVDAAREGEFAAILMDCEMPEMDGFEATRAIREWDAALPIVALTAQAIDGDRARCLEAGMTEYVTKPIDRDDLLTILSGCLRGSDSPGRSNRSEWSEVSGTSDRSDGADRHAGSDGELRESLDLEELLDRCAGQRDVATRVLGMFRDQSRVQFDQMEAAWRSADLDELRRVSHLLKGSSANVAASAVRGATEAVEQAATSHAGEDLGPLIARVEDTLASCHREIDYLLNDSPTLS